MKRIVISRGNPFIVAVTVAVFSLSAWAQNKDCEEAKSKAAETTNCEREVRRVPRASTYKDESLATIYKINGHETWRRTEVEAKRGQKVEIRASGSIRWAQNGFEQIEVTADGARPPYRDGWNYNHFPYPAAGIGSLIMRIGIGIYPVGSSTAIEVEDDGFIEFMINDDVLADNSGAFDVKVEVKPK